MNTQQDFEEFLRLLEKHDCDYVIVGGYAVAFYGYPRFTKDLDIFYDESCTNVQKLRSALVEFGFGAEDIPPALFTPGAILNFGIEPVRIDLLNRIDGVDFQEARTHSVRGKYGKVQVRFIGLAELKRNKKSTGRIQDAADLEKLGDS
jgi:predicted nucleotidyltransferase